MKNFIYLVLVFLLDHSKAFKSKVLAIIKEIRRVLQTESEESIQMVEIYNRALMKKASKEELKWANDQFGDILKTLGLGALLILPFAPITMPFIIKLAQYLGINIYPNSVHDPKQGENKLNLPKLNKVSCKKEDQK